MKHSGKSLKTLNYLVWPPDIGSLRIISSLSIPHLNLKGSSFRHLVVSWHSVCEHSTPRRMLLFLTDSSSWISASHSQHSYSCVLDWGCCQSGPDSWWCSLWPLRSQLFSWFDFFVAAREVKIKSGRFKWYSAASSDSGLSSLYLLRCVPSSSRAYFGTWLGTWSELGLLLLGGNALCWHADLN